MRMKHIHVKSFQQSPRRNPLRSRWWCRYKTFSGHRFIVERSRLPPWKFVQQKLQANWLSKHKTLKEKRESHRHIVEFYKIMAKGRM